MLCTPRLSQVHHLKTSVSTERIHGRMARLTFVTEVEGEEDRTTGRGNSIHCSSYVLRPPSSVDCRNKMCHTNQKELQSLVNIIKLRVAPTQLTARP